MTTKSHAESSREKTQVQERRKLGESGHSNVAFHCGFRASKLRSSTGPTVWSRFYSGTAGGSCLVPSQSFSIGAAGEVVDVEKVETMGLGASEPSLWNPPEQQPKQIDTSSRHHLRRTEHVCLYVCMCVTKCEGFGPSAVLFATDVRCSPVHSDLTSDCYSDRLYQRPLLLSL